MSEQSERDAMVERVWRTYLTTGEIDKERRQRHFFRLLPERRVVSAVTHPYGALAVPLSGLSITSSRQT